MGKATKGLRGQIAEIRAGKRAMDKEAGFEFGVTKSANKAGVANLNAQLGRINRQMQGVTKRTTKNVAHLTQRSKAVERQTRAKQDASISRYGSSLAGSVHQQFQTAEATSEAGVQGLRGARTVAARGANMAKGVAAIAAQGAKAQKASGDYALAQALKARYQVSAETAFEAEQAIRLQQLEFQQQKKLLELQQEEESATGEAGVSTVVDSALSSVSGLRDLFNEANDKGEYMNAQEVALTYITENNITDPAEKSLINALASKMYQAGAGPEQEGNINYGAEMISIANQSVKQTIQRLYPKMWKKHGDTLLGLVDTASDAWATKDATAQAAMASSGPVGAVAGAGFDTNANLNTAIQAAVSGVTGGNSVAGNFVADQTTAQLAQVRVNDLVSNTKMSASAIVAKMKQEYPSYPWTVSAIEKAIKAARS